MKKILIVLISFSFTMSLPDVYGQGKSNAQTACQQKEETIKTIFQLLPESERSCSEIAKLVLTEEDEEGEKLDTEYQSLFLKVCELKRQKHTLEEIREHLGLPKQCNSLSNAVKKN